MRVTPSGGSRIAQEIRSRHIAAGAKGINAIANLSQMDPEECIYSYNMIPTQRGSQIRAGYSEWATNCDTQVRSVIPYKAADPTNDRLFACTNANILDVTSSTDTPAVDQAFASSTADTGYCAAVPFTTAAGRFMCLTDEQNGYYVYSESGDSWSKPTQGSGASQIDNVDPATFAHVCSWKSRLWFAQKNTSKAWYLAAGAIYGAATEFDFGSKFVKGGTLVGLFSWTVDGGEGIDDYLVAISSGGDVIVYKGTDPSSASTFALHGKWDMGDTPKGRRCVGSFGGELYLLSTFGLLPISKLMSGQPVIERNIYATEKITPLVYNQMLLYREEYGWEVRFVPSRNLLLISVPNQDNTPPIQFVRDLNTQGWAIYRDIPYISGDTWKGDFYIGTPDGRVLKHTGTVDNQLYSDPEDFEDIEFSMLTSFMDYDALGSTMCNLVRPVFLSGATPSFYVQTRYDYYLVEVTDAPPATSAFGSLWDVGLWDSALWGPDFLVVGNLYGGSGIGRAMAHAIRGNTSSETTLVRLDVHYTKGNILGT